MSLHLPHSTGGGQTRAQSCSSLGFTGETQPVGHCEAPDMEWQKGVILDKTHETKLAENKSSHRQADREKHGDGEGRVSVCIHHLGGKACGWASAAQDGIIPFSLVLLCISGRKKGHPHHGTCQGLPGGTCCPAAPGLHGAESGCRPYTRPPLPQSV